MRRTIRDLTNAERNEAVRAYLAGSTIEQIARRFRLGLVSIRHLLVSRGVQIRGREEAQPPAYVPTPEEIEEQKVELRKSWVKDDCNRNGEAKQPRVPKVYRLLGTER